MCTAAKLKPQHINANQSSEKKCLGLLKWAFDAYYQQNTAAFTFNDKSKINFGVTLLIAARGTSEIVVGWKERIKFIANNTNSIMIEVNKLVLCLKIENWCNLKALELNSRAANVILAAFGYRASRRLHIWTSCPSAELFLDTVKANSHWKCRKPISIEKNGSFRARTFESLQSSSVSQCMRWLDECSLQAMHQPIKANR